MQNDKTDKLLAEIIPVLSQVSIGKRPKLESIPEEEKVAEIYVGIKLLLESIVEKEATAKSLLEKINELHIDTVAKKKREAELEAEIDKCYAELEQLKQVLNKNQ
jgi:hypothetical protein